MTTKPNQPKDLVATNSIVATDLIVVQTKPSETSNTKVQKITANNLFSNSTYSVRIGNGQYLYLMSNNTPANSTANCIQGQTWSDGNYIYYAVANNVIKRAQLVSF
jgi:hypothetical protein